MHDWLMRNLTLLAFLLILGVVAIAGLALVLVGGGAGLLFAAMYLLGIAIAYGILLRFVVLCDDIAAIRRQ